MSSIGLDVVLLNKNRIMTGIFILISALLLTLIIGFELKTGIISEIIKGFFR